ncbi:MAG: UvrB/UvrC motif-containing protein, partial [Candidatus Marinimicrobia bacterium]|nr:UvrB/UvrC motif-containing protein [Candidatus Neomarinimicrobiota bacterium]
EIQESYNIEEGITPTTISKSTENILFSTSIADSIEYEDYDVGLNRKGDDFSKMDKQLALDMMRKEMLEASDDLEFEKAAKLRDEIKKLEKELEGIF